MRNTYHMVLEDGHMVDVKADTAAEAIELARWAYRGFRVSSCHIGLTEAEAQYIPKSKAGAIFFDIPKHDPIPVDIVAPDEIARAVACIRGKRLRRPAPIPEPTMVMFPESEILAESSAAKAKTKDATF